MPTHTRRLTTSRRGCTRSLAWKAMPNACPSQCSPASNMRAQNTPNVLDKASNPQHTCYTSCATAFNVNKYTVGSYRASRSDFMDRQFAAARCAQNRLIRTSGCPPQALCPRSNKRRKRGS
eukprot:9412907-Lingulodinium_polyedra.AAC.1